MLALALAAVGTVASGHNADAQQSRYPESSTSYRKRMDSMVKVLRARCLAACPPTERERIMAAISKVESRVMDVCADGWVTSAENDYVFSVMPAPPTPHPRPN